MKRTTFIAALVVCIMASALLMAAKPSGEQIMSALKRNFDAVRDYRADVSLTAKGEKVSIKGTKMIVYFKKPNKVHIDAVQGFAAVPSGSFFGNPLTEISANAKPVYLGTEKKLGKDCHLLKLVNPKGPANSEVKLWVDKAAPVIVAMETSGNFGIETAWRHTKVDGKYYMPSQIVADVKAPKGSNGLNQSMKVTLKFSNYSVNKGISDKIFEEERPRKSGDRR